MTSEIEEINEIPPLIIVKFKNGYAFLLPKDKISNITLLTEWLKELTAAILNLPYNIDDQWTWK